MQTVSNADSLHEMPNRVIRDYIYISAYHC